MKIKLYFYNLLLTLTSIYIPLFLASSYYYFRDKPYIPSKIESEKIISIKKGYKPLFNPNSVIGELNQNSQINFYPIGSLPNTKTYWCNEGYGLIQYKSDRFGLRNKDKKWNNFDKNTNIFVIGDSSAHGACVPDESTIPSTIEKNLRLNTFNLASASNGPYEYQATLKTVIEPLVTKSKNQNYVVIVFHANDNLYSNQKQEALIKSISPIIKINSGNKVLPTKSYVSNISELIKKNYPQSPKEIVEALKKNNTNESFIKYASVLTPIRKKIKQVFKNYLYKAEKKPTISEKTISMLSDICKIKCRPIIAFIPHTTGLISNPKSLKYREELMSIANKEKRPFADGTKVLDHNKENFAPYGGHLSIRGYEKVSNLIINIIVNDENFKNK